MENKISHRKKHKITWFVLIGVLFFLPACTSPISNKSSEKELATAFAHTAEVIALDQIEREIVTPTSTRVPSVIATIPFTDGGSLHQFVICKVSDGDLLEKYAEIFNTSVGAIIRVNYALSLPLWNNALVVIPVDFTDVEQLPYFQPYRVTAEVIALKDLALELDVNFDKLIYYNSLNGKSEVHSGEWLIIPRTSPGF